MYIWEKLSRLIAFFAVICQYAMGVEELEKDAKLASQVRVALR